jgi:hypothetical protein
LAGPRRSATGKERFDADIHGKAALHDGLDLALDDAALFENLGDLLPVLPVSSALLREDDHPFVILQTHEEHFDLVTHLRFLAVVKLAQGMIPSLL